MSELRYPNESREYRDARDALLKDEQELVDKVKSVAEKRRNPSRRTVERGLRLPMGQRWESREECEILRAILGQEHPAALLIHVRSELGQSLSFLYVADRWV
jgi:hypothetical protein